MAQYYRDARILPISEGTNGIQSNDLMFRKVLRDGGAALTEWMKDVAGIASASPELQGALKDLQKVVGHLTGLAKNPDALAYAAVPFLRMVGLVAGGAMLVKSAGLAHKTGDTGFTALKLLTCQVFLAQCLGQVSGLSAAVLAESWTALGVSQAEV